MELQSANPEIDFQKLFESCPDSYLLLSPDLIILNASNSYLENTITKRDEIVGRGLFDVFPDNPDDPEADGVSNLYASLCTVMQTRKPHTMPVQKYDIRRPDGSYEERFWSPVNSPVLNDSNEVLYIIHKVEDVTAIEQMKKEVAAQVKTTNELAEKHTRHLKESEDRFFKIFNLTPVAIYLTDIADGRFLQVNRAFEELFHLKNAEVIGRTVIELNITDEQKRFDAIKKINAQNGRAVDLELDLQTANGDTRKMLVSTEIIEIDDRKCFLVAMVDITERKKTEDALIQTNHFLDAILENIPDMVFVKDAQDLRFIRFNKAGEDILGYSRQDLIGKNDYDFFPEDQAVSFTARDKEVFENNTLLNIAEEPIQTTRGERWLHTKKIPLYENGQPAYLLGISEDITERKKQQDSVLQLNKELNAFTYSVSHDLRSPLRAINGYAQILAEDYTSVLDQEGKRFLGKISSNAERMGRLIDDLLAFSRLGKAKPDVTATDMNELVERAIAEINKTVTYTAEIQTGSLHTINSDPGLMMQVLINLIGNAIKYSSKREKPLIEINSKLAGSDAIFWVKDNGAGFDMRYVHKLFGVFQRLHTNDEFEGTGVGLAIVQRIINKHGGKVWAEGKPDEGATMYFSLPV
jgi:PAS domain S-box-containing protein